ncbi:hypothetical protein HDR59_01240, partial [bacterium]|nr:hypothetical protein [bacterium]
MKTINKISINDIGKIFGISIIVSLLTFISYLVLKDFVFMYDDDIY